MIKTVNANYLARCLGLLITCSLSVASFGQPVNLVQNGNFGSGLSDWMNSGVGVFLGYSGEAANGDVNFVNIAGGGYLYQDLTTTPGQIYDLSFAMAGNINWPGAITMDTLWGGNIVDVTTWNPGGHTVANLGWLYENVAVTAASSQTLLEFENPSQQINQQPFLDAVSVTALPEASTLNLVAASIVITVFKRRPGILRCPDGHRLSM